MEVRMMNDIAANTSSMTKYNYPKGSRQTIRGIELDDFLRNEAEDKYTRT